MKIRNLAFGSRRRIAATSVIGVLLVCSCTALAAWLINGTASLRGSTASITAPTILPATGSATTTAVPGGNGSLDVLITNPNSVGLKINQLNLAPQSITTTNPGCAGTNFTLNPGPVNTALFGYTAAANSVDIPLSIPNGVSLDLNAPTACMAVDITVNLAASAVRWTTDLS